MTRLKKTIFSIFGMALLATGFIACSSDDNATAESIETTETMNSTMSVKEGEVKLDLTPFVLKKEIMDKVISDIKTKKEVIHDLEEKEVKTILNPLLENGRVLHKEMIFFLERNNELEQLSNEERHSILNLTDEQLIELSFLTYNQHQYTTTSNIDWPRVRGCASFALGIRGIKTLYTNTLALGTVETMVGALKLIGKRYLGYIGIALMIYDFVDCLYGSE